MSLSSQKAATAGFGGRTPTMTSTATAAHGGDEGDDTTITVASSKLTFVDLAGSEWFNDSAAHDKGNDGDGEGHLRRTDKNEEGGL